MHYYTEAKRDRPNGRVDGDGQPITRGDPTLAHWLLAQGALYLGFDGDGTKGGGTVRLWPSAKKLVNPPAGIEKISKAAYDRMIAHREANKPVHPLRLPPDPAERDFTPAERKQLRALLD
jgi:hypothetical protein